MRCRQRLYGIISAAFYGYSAGFPVALASAGFHTNMIDVSVSNLFIYPMLSAVAFSLPKVAKTFAELENSKK